MKDRELTFRQVLEQHPQHHDYLQIRWMQNQVGGVLPILYEYAQNDEMHPPTKTFST